MTAITNSKARQYGVVKKELLEIKKKYPGKRMSQIVHEGALNDVEVDLNAKIKRDGYVVLHYNGNIKFVLEKGYNTAVKSIVNCAVNDIAKKVIKTDSEGMIFGITSKGNAITFPVSALGEDKWKSKGMGINKIAKVDSDDKLLAIFTSDELKGKKLFIVTSMGMAKYIEETSKRKKKSRLPAQWHSRTRMTL